MTACKLNERDRAEILLGQHTSHLADCPSCAEAFARQSELWKILDAWDMPPVSSGSNRSLYAKIDAAAAAPWYERWASAIKPVFAQPSFAIGMAAVVIVGGFFFDHSAPSVKPVANPAVQVSTTEAEQVEKTLEDLEMLHQFDPGSEEKDASSKAM